jgi:predicted metal-dependent phosphoesterase TrpH
MNRHECDLHCHTTRSDGNDTPADLIDNAAAAGVRVVAITDHDVQPPLSLCVDARGSHVDIHSYARERGVELVLGYEFSCDTYVDDVHILGYRMDWTSEELAREVKRARESKTEAYMRLCEKLTSKGMPLDFEEDVLALLGGSNEGKSASPDEVERKHVFEAMARKGYAPTWKDAKLIVRDDPELNVRREKIDPVRAIHLIKSLGGTAVLAHPLLIDETVSYPDGRVFTRREYIWRLICEGLDGMEASYPYSKTSYKGRWSDTEAEAYIRGEFGSKLKLLTGGSDYHADERKGVSNPRYIGEGGISLKEYEAVREFLRVQSP